MTLFIEQELSESVLPLVVPYVKVRAGHYGLVELPGQSTQRFVQQVGFNLRSPLTSFRFKNIFDPGVTDVQFYEIPLDGSIVSILNQQYQIMGTIDGTTTLTPPLRQQVSNQHSANLTAVPLQLIDIIASRTFRIVPTQKIVPHDVIQMGNARLTVLRVNETPGSTEIHCEEQINNANPEQSIWLLAAPLTSVPANNLTDGLPNSFAPSSPFLLELPVATHLDIDYTAYWTIRQLMLDGSQISSQEVLFPNETLIMGRPISAGSLLLWDKVGDDQSLNWNDSQLIMMPGLDGRCSIESGWLVPIWPNQQIDQYIVRVRASSGTTIRFQLWPNPPQDRTFTGLTTLRFDGPARMEQPIQSIRISTYNGTFDNVFVGDFVPSPTVEEIGYDLLLVPSTDEVISRHDIVWMPPLVKPLWPNVRDLYLKTDIGSLDSGWVIGV